MCLKLPNDLLICERVCFAVQREQKNYKLAILLLMLEGGSAIDSIAHQSLFLLGNPCCGFSENIMSLHS